MAKLYKGSTRIRKVYRGSTRIRKIFKGSTLVYSAIPDALFTNGAYDGEYLTGVNGASIENKAISCGIRFSVYSDEDTQSKTWYSNYMDLSGAKAFNFDGYTQIVGYYHHTVTATISLEDSKGNSVTIGTKTQNMGVQSGDSAITQSSDFNMTKNSFGNVDMTNVRLKIDVSYWAHIPWGNWYSSAGTIFIENITCS